MTSEVEKIEKTKELLSNLIMDYDNGLIGIEGLLYYISEVIDYLEY